MLVPQSPIKRNVLLRVFCVCCISICVRSEAAAPEIDVISPAGELWTDSTAIVFDVNVTDSLDTYAFVNWDNSLVGWWRGDGNSLDSSSYGHTGVIKEDGIPIGPKYATDSRFGQAFTFSEGQHLDLSCPDHLNFQSDDSFTVALWMKKTSDTITTVINKRSALAVTCFAETGWIATLGGTGGRQARNAGVSTRSWVHLAIVYNGNSRELYTYSDGILTTSWREGSVPDYVDTSNALTIGNPNILVDEILIFNRPLAATEIAALHSTTAANLQTTFSGLKELSEYSYSVYAVNADGDANSLSGLLTVDTPNSTPEVAATSTSSVVRVSETEYTFAIDARSTDGDTTLTSAVLYWDYGQEWGPASDVMLLDGQEDTASWVMTELTEGPITWNVLVTDSNGNSSFVSTNQVVYIGQTDYYVSMDGDDSNPGTIAKPFRHIQRFADMALPGDTCWIREGVYRETVTPANSGTAADPITFKAYPGEAVSISGADAIEGVWTVHDGSIYKTTAMDWDLGIGKNQVFVAGAAMIEARWPNSGDIYQPEWSLMQEGSTGEDTGGGNWELTIIDEPNLVQPEGYWVGAIASCSFSYGGYSAIVTESRVGQLKAEMPSGWRADHVFNMGANTGSPYYLIGTYHALDTPGEWYYDSDDDTLYLWPPEGVDLGTTLVEARTNRDHGFDLSGKSYIQIEGIDLFACDLVMDIRSSYNCIDDMEALYPTHFWYLTFDEYKDARDEGTGVVIHGHDNTLQNSTVRYAAGNCVSLGGYNNTVQDCDIGYASYTRLLGAALATGPGATDGLHVLRNKIHRAGVSTVYLIHARSAKFLYNEVSYCNYGRELWDLGLLYINGTISNGTEIAYNRLHDGYYAGIYLDTECHRFNIHHNLVSDMYRDHWRYGGLPLGLHMNTPGTDNRICHNTMPNTWITVNSGYAPRTFEGSAIQDNLADWVNVADGDVGLVASNNINTLLGLGAGAPHYAKDPNTIYVDFIGGDFRLRA